MDATDLALRGVVTLEKEHVLCRDTVLNAQGLKHRYCEHGNDQ